MGRNKYLKCFCMAGEMQKFERNVSYLKPCNKLSDTQVCLARCVFKTVLLAFQNLCNILFEIERNSSLGN